MSERRHSESARATSAALINYMHVHYNLISGREKEEPIVQIPKYEHSDYSVFNACVCMSTLVLFATPWHISSVPLATRLSGPGVRGPYARCHLLAFVVACDVAQNQHPFRKVLNEQDIALMLDYIKEYG